MKKNSHMKLLVRVCVVFAALFIYTGTLLAVAFPFREFEEGDPVPDVTLKPLETGPPVTFSGLRGKPFIAVFWGADLPEKIKHSATILAELEELGPFLNERGVQRLSVNVQNDERAAIDEVRRKSGSSMDVYLDENKKAYGTLGIFVMPTVLLVDAQGKVAAGMGYSHDLRDRLKGAVQIMLGEKTAAQVEAELRPEMTEASDEEKASRRHFDFGMVMLKRGQTDGAIREFARVIEIAPDMAEAHLQLGCLYLARDDLENAEKAIAKALELDPESPQGKICHAELLRLKGDLNQAAELLKAVMAAHPDRYDASYGLGRVLEDLGQAKEAVEAYKDAYLKIRAHSVKDR
ncbi:MAG: hypothetical protein Kow0089_10420 [Desulfobulbaceae bacterium]